MPLHDPNPNPNPALAPTLNPNPNPNLDSSPTPTPTPTPAADHRRPLDGYLSEQSGKQELYQPRYLQPYSYP